MSAPAAEQRTTLAAEGEPERGTCLACAAPLLSILVAGRRVQTDLLELSHGGEFVGLAVALDAHGVGRSVRLPSSGIRNGEALHALHQTTCEGS